jgi:hypothetical protein
MHRRAAGALAFTYGFTATGCSLPDTHDRGLRLLHLPSGKASPVLRGDGPFTG